MGGLLDGFDSRHIPCCPTHGKKEVPQNGVHVRVGIVLESGGGRSGGVDVEIGGSMMSVDELRARQKAEKAANPFFQIPQEVVNPPKPQKSRVRPHRALYQSKFGATDTVEERELKAKINAQIDLYYQRRGKRNSKKVQGLKEKLAALEALNAGFVEGEFSE